MNPVLPSTGLFRPKRVPEIAPVLPTCTHFISALPGASIDIACVPEVVSDVDLDLEPGSNRRVVVVGFRSHAQSDC